MVPILAPSIIPRAFDNGISPAPINARINKDTKELDCNIAVINPPENIEFNFPLVLFCKKDLNFLHPKCFSAFSSCPIPKKKNPNPPIKM